MKKITNLIFLLLTLITISSCRDMIVQPEGKAPLAVSIELAESKNLSVQSPLEITHYRYKAIPSSKNEEDHITGATLEWTDIILDSTKKATLGYLSQGEWTVWVRAYNVNNTAIFEGFAKEIIRNGAKNYFFINLEPIFIKEGVTKVTFDFTITDIRNGNIKQIVPHIKLYRLISNNTIDTNCKPVNVTFNMAEIAGGQLKLTGVTTEVEVGGYLMSVELYTQENVFITGQLLPISVIGNSATHVIGHLEQGSYINGFFDIKQAIRELQASLVVNMGTDWAPRSKGYMASNKVGNTAKLKVVPAQNFVIDKTEWAIDGNYITNIVEYIIDPSKMDSGPHQLSVTVKGRDTTASAQEEKVMHLSKILYIIAETDWVKVRDGQFSNGGAK